MLRVLAALLLLACTEALAGSIPPVNSDISNLYPGSIVYLTPSGDTAGATDTARIAAGLTAAAGVPGSSVTLSCGVFYISGSGESALTATQPLTFSGSGQCTILLPVANVPNTRNILRLTAPGVVSIGWVFRDFQIAGGKGRCGLFFDATASDANAFVGVLVERVTIYTDATATNGGALCADSNVGNFRGGIYHATFRDNVLNGGMYFNHAGDSLRFDGNLISTNGRVYIDQVSGAAGLNFRANNITLPGMVTLRGGAFFVWDSNEMEQIATNTSANNAMLDLIDTNGGTVFGGNITALDGSGSPVPIRISGTNTKINAIALNTVSGSQDHVVIVAGAGNSVGADVICSGSGAPPCVVGP